MCDALANTYFLGLSHRGGKTLLCDLWNAWNAVAHGAPAGTEVGDE